MKFTEATYLNYTLRLYKDTGEGSGFVILIHPFSEDVELLSIPQYGGEERHEGWFQTIDCALEEAEKWT